MISDSSDEEEPDKMITDRFFPDNYDDEELINIRRRYPIPRNTWIVKPGENSNRGVGINVAHDMQDIKHLVMDGSKRDP